MAINIKTPEEIQIMKEGGKILAFVLEETLKYAKPEMSTLELDEFAEKLIIEKGGKPAFKGFNGFKHTLCVCINDEIVHGIPKKDRIIKNGDLLTIDCGLIYKGLNTDAARSKVIGSGGLKEKYRLIECAWEALDAGISVAKVGNDVSDISKEIERVIRKYDYYAMKQLTGHGIGRTLHEPPEVLNYYNPNEPKVALVSGMTIAIEPILATSNTQMRTLSDHWTIVTRDGSLSVQVENTIAIRDFGPLILTQA